MNSSVNSYVKQGQELADSAADQAQTLGRRGMAAVNDAAQQAIDSATDLTDSVIAYTKKNPGTALLIAVASGALLITLAKLLASSRD